MKRLTQLVFVSAVVTVAACTDKPVEKANNLTSPGRPRLTMSSLPPTASTVCVAAVKERDALLAKSDPKPTSRIDDLDALVDDTCY
jgi:hypothetical protein